MTDFSITEAVKLGLVDMWWRRLPGIGLTGPFYGLSDRGRQLAAALLRPRQSRRRSGDNKGEPHVSAR